MVKQKIHSLDLKVTVTSVSLRLGLNKNRVKKEKEDVTGDSTPAKPVAPVMC